MQKLPKIAKMAQNGKNGKGAKVKVDPWSPPMMFTDHKIYEKNPKKLIKRPKNAGTAQTGQKIEKWALFHSDPNEIFKLLHIPNRLVQTLSER